MKIWAAVIWGTAQTATSTTVSTIRAQVWARRISRAMPRPMMRVIPTVPMRKKRVRTRTGTN